MAGQNQKQMIERETDGRDTGPGPFRRGATRTLFYWSWLYLLWTQMDMAIAWGYPYTRQMSMIYWPFFGRNNHPDLAWPVLELLPFLVSIVLLGLFGGGIAVAHDRFVRPRLRQDVDFREIYRDATGFFRRRPFFFIIWGVPFTLSFLLSKIAFVSLIKSIDGEMVESPYLEEALYVLPVFYVGTILYSMFMWFVAVFQYKGTINGSLENTKSLLIPALKVFLIATLLNFFLHMPLELVYLIEKWGGYDWPFLVVVTEPAGWCIYLFSVIFAVVYIRHREPLKSSLKHTAGLFNNNFSIYLRFFIDIARKLFPSFFVGLLFYSWSEHIAPMYRFIAEAYDLQGPLVDFLSMLHDVLLGSINWLLREWGWVYVFPLLIFPLIWLSMTPVALTFRLDAENEPVG